MFLCSSEKHLNEIEKAGLERPAVNQVEVRINLTRNSHRTMLTLCGQLHPWCQQRQIVAYCKSNGIIVQAYTPLVKGKDVAEGKGIKNEVVLRIAKKVRLSGDRYIFYVCLTGIPNLARQESRPGSDSLVAAERPCTTSQGYFRQPNRGELQGVRFRPRRGGRGGD